MKVKVKYLNWDKEPNAKLMLGVVTGEVFTKEFYREVIELDVKEITRGYEHTTDELLSLVFSVMNVVDEDAMCYVPENERSMCVGDLIYIANEVYVVSSIGFRKVS